jgi:DNA-binding response OmpR family regulator
MTDILVIDDDAVYGELTLERLEATAYTAVFQLGPFGTVNAIRQLQPKLVILDINMPGLDGTRISELVRKTRGMEHTRVLFHSSLDQSQLEPLVREHGADGGLAKSASRNEFLSEVERLMRRGPRSLAPR